MSPVNSREQDRAYDILLLESGPDNIEPFADAFTTIGKTVNIHGIEDGAAALDFLNQCGEYTDAPRPDLILLDLQLPNHSGMDILAELYDRPEWRRIPVIVVTASIDAEEIARSYELSANAYIQKPSTTAEFEDVASAIGEFWLQAAHLPSK